MPNVFPLTKAVLPLWSWHFDYFQLSIISQGNNLAIIAICGISKWVEGKTIRSNNS